MPELPEVETIVKGLNQRVKNRTIKNVWTDWPKYFGGQSENQFKKSAIGRKIVKIERRGKNILFFLNSGFILLIHQKISGHLLVGRWRLSDGKWFPQPPKGPLADPINRFIRLIFFLDKGLMLVLSDLRRFAKILIGPAKKILDSPDLKLGPEPLALNFQKFQEIFMNPSTALRTRKGRIKQVLMDQSFISGIGNIYSDEILWLAKINPLTRVEKLGEANLKTLFNAIKRILKKAVKLGGTSADDYRQVTGQPGHYFEVRYAYQKEGEPCQRCRTKIKRIKISGRSAHFCPRCQKL